MDPEKGENDEGLSDAARSMQRAQPWIGAVWKLVGGCVVGVLGGMGVDRWLGTSPWGLVVLSMLGICAGFYGLIFEMNRLAKRTSGK